MTNELSALALVATDAIDRYGITPIELMHRGIAGRVFRNVGPMALPARVAHDRAADLTYRATRQALNGAGAALAAGARRRAGHKAVRPLSTSPRGRFVVAALNAAAGERLAAQGNDLQIHMALRHRGDDVSLTPSALRRVAPRASHRAVLFVHGLAENEEWWTRRRRRSLGAMLRRDGGFTPLYVRYNTGLHISDNGEQLASLLDTLTRAWPVPLDEIVLIGHSMGGLVLRAACHAGTEQAHEWTQRVTHLVTLGTPHHGAPLAKAVHALSWALRPLPEGAPFAHILDVSHGIADLRFGALHPEDWHDGSHRPFRDNRRRHVPLLPHARTTFVTATLSVNATHPVGLALGDLLVRTESASGRCSERTIEVPSEQIVHLGGLTHFDLLDHPLVHDLLRDVIVRGAALVR